MPIYANLQDASVPILDARASTRSIIKSSLWWSVSSPHHTLDPTALKLSNTLLESLNLLPAIQRSTIVSPQALDDVLPGSLHSGVDLVDFLDLSAFLQLLAELRNIPGHGLATKRAKCVSSCGFFCGIIVGILRGVRLKKGGERRLLPCL